MVKIASRHSVTIATILLPIYFTAPAQITCNFDMVYIVS